MKTLTLNGDGAIATAAFTQIYDSFAWDNGTAFTAFDFGIEQTLFESLEADFSAHVFVSTNQVIWSDGTETITLSTDANLSVDDTLRSAQCGDLLAYPHYPRHGGNSVRHKNPCLDGVARWPKAGAH